MSTESLNRTSNVINDPSQVINTRVNVDVLKQRIIDQKKKDKFKRPIILIVSKKLLCSQMKKLNFDFNINLIDKDKIDYKKLDNKKINLRSECEMPEYFSEEENSTLLKG